MEGIILVGYPAYIAYRNFQMIALRFGQDQSCSKPAHHSPHQGRTPDFSIYRYWASTCKKQFLVHQEIFFMTSFLARISFSVKSLK